MKVDSVVSFFDWNEHPFTFRILSDFFVGYEDEKNRAVQSIRNGDKFLLILGPTGSGKTTFLRYLSSVFDGRGVIYLPKPPEDPAEWVVVFRKIWKPRFSLLRRSQDVDLFNLTEKLNDRADKGLVLFVDECHEASIESLEWLRAIVDQTDNLLLVMAGLPVFEKILKENLETLMKRVTNTIKLSNLTRYETRELIKRRVEGMGGEDIKPFTPETVEYIYEKTGGFPREILRECNELVSRAYQRNVSVIDISFVRDSSQKERIKLDSMAVLPERQRGIINVLAEGGSMTPSEIVSKLDPAEYKSKDNAIRSVNNLLRRLMGEGLVERQRTGKSYKYRVSGKFQSLMVSR